MKKLFFAGLCALMAVVNLPLRATTHADTWYFLEHDWMDDVFYGGKYYLEGDTLINDMTYRQLKREGGYCRAAFVGGLRQSADGMQVYWYKAAAQEEYLLYDFGAETGDTIRNAYFDIMDMHIYIDHMGEPELPFWVVTDKQIVDGRIHMTVARYSDEEEWRGIPYYQTTWIQGIGTAHVLWPHMYADCGPTTLYAVCVMNGDETLYSYDLSQMGITHDCADWQWQRDALEETHSDDVFTGTGTPYNILGQPVDENYHGIVIQNGQKRVQ